MAPNPARGPWPEGELKKFFDPLLEDIRQNPGELLSLEEVWEDLLEDVDEGTS